jgi:tetratricopeptide (TPR) repeat protein
MTEDNEGEIKDDTIEYNKNSEHEDVPEPLNEIIKNHDIDELVNFLKNSKDGNSNDVLNLNTSFIEHHLSGVDMFLELAVKLEPENAEHHYNRALFLENQKAYEAAKEEYKVAIDLDNKNESYYSEYGNLLMALNDLGGAERQYLEALQINPTNANVWTNLGILYTNNKDIDKAENALKKAISLEPNSTLPYLNLIKLYRGTGKKNEAIEIKNLYKSLKLDSLEINIMHLDR